MISFQHASTTALCALLAGLAVHCAAPPPRDDDDEPETPPTKHPTTAGMPSAETTRSTVIQTLREVVLPGFDALGIATGPARSWAEARGVDRE